MRRSAQKRKIRRRRQFGEPRLKLDQKRRSSAYEMGRRGITVSAGSSLRTRLD
jgi:hypothetical protein